MEWGWLPGRITAYRLPLPAPAQPPEGLHSSYRLYPDLARAVPTVSIDETVDRGVAMGLGPEDAVVRNPLKEYQSEFGDPKEFTYGALRSMMIAYVPD